MLWDHCHTNVDAVTGPRDSFVASKKSSRADCQMVPPATSDNSVLEDSCEVDTIKESLLNTVQEECTPLQGLAQRTHVRGLATSMKYANKSDNLPSKCSDTQRNGKLEINAAALS